ncbi:MAG TPA: SDR family NAD(P)-dependent oxidoreductase, partial [Candidatus Gracilibacteria bacterium]|nr:SDR family NAD(P)-dependent oxidoreductase [Candidatus Gracilibacteria bacterium]
EMSKEDFEKVIAVNLGGVFLCTKYASEQMKKQWNGGKIMNISSIDALHPSAIGLAHYDASKHGVWGFTKNSALELASHKIWVNAIAPGAIATPGVAEMQKATAGKPVDMTKVLEAFLNKIPMHRMGEPDDIGKVALFLASDMSSYMTGEQIVVDGGVLLSGIFWQTGYPWRLYLSHGNFFTSPVFDHHVPSPHISPALEKVSPMKTRIYIIGSSRNGFWAGGKCDDHIRNMIRAPLYPAILIPMPRMSATPTHRSPNMKRKSVTGGPAMDWYNDANGPVADFRYPRVGEFPLSHDLSGDVEKPSPQSLSRNAQSNSHPMQRRKSNQIYSCFELFIKNNSTPILLSLYILWSG